MTNADLLPAAALKRKAVVSVRQSTRTQVRTHLESQRRRYGREPADPDIAISVRANSDDLCLSVISVIEITADIRGIRREGAGQRLPDWEKHMPDWESWLGRIGVHYGDRILPIDAKVGALAGELLDATGMKAGDQGFSSGSVCGDGEGPRPQPSEDGQEEFSPSDARRSACGSA